MTIQAPRKNVRLEIIYADLRIELSHKDIHEADIILLKTKMGHCVVLKDKTGRLL